MTSPDIEALVEDLHSDADELDCDPEYRVVTPGVIVRIREAASTLTTLQAQLAELKGELATAREAGVILRGDAGAVETYRSLRARAEAAERERDALKAEIEAASAMLDKYDAPTHDVGDGGGPLSIADRIEAKVYADSIAHWPLPSREAVARILATDAFAFGFQPERGAVQNDVDAACERALVKADAILALFALPGGNG